MWDVIKEGMEDKNSKNNIAGHDLAYLSEIFGVGFLGQFCLHYIHYYPTIYCNSLRFVSRQWKEASEHPLLWNSSATMLNSLVKFRAKLELVRKKLFPRFANQLSLSTEENTGFVSYKKTPYDSAFDRFDKLETCGPVVRFPILGQIENM